MKTICFITRCHPARPNMQKVCFDSVKAQTCDDYQHFLIQGAMREEADGTPAVEWGLKKTWPIDARYVMVLDDDNALVYPDFVKEFKELTQKENPDIVIFRGNLKGTFGIIPSYSWGKSPSYADIDWSCYALKKEVWDKYINVIEHETGNRNDYILISTCFQNTKSAIWFNHLVVETQKTAGSGRSETEF